MAKNKNRVIPPGYYVYEWYRVSDGHVFYVGKGSGDRMYHAAKTKRNPHFYHYVKKYKCDCRVVKDGLTEHEAYVLENDICKKRQQNNECECNIADTSFCNGGPGLKGEKNGMYGKTHTPEVRKFLSQVNLDRHNVGENNCQYGVSPKERMSKETYERWCAKQRARKDGHKNPNSHNVLMINIKTGDYKTFEAIVECIDYVITLKDFENFSREDIRYRIKYSNKKKAIYFNWVFVIYKKDKFVNIDDTVSSFYRVEEDVTTTENINNEKDIIE